MNNLSKRIIAAFAGIPIIIGASYLGGIVFLIFSITAASIALWELYSMLEMREFRIIKIPAITCSILYVILFWYFGSNNNFLYFIIIIFMCMEIFRKEEKSPINPAITIFGIIYVTIPFILLYELLIFPSQINYVILLFILIWSCDTAAYFGGKYLGRHQLSKISPKKTIEGSVTGFLFTVIISLIVHFIFPEKISTTDSVIIGIITGVFAQAGDLFESLIKRYCGVKDSSNIIPGHGGVLDRFDSLLFVTPVVYIYINLKIY